MNTCKYVHKYKKSILPHCLLRFLSDSLSITTLKVNWKDTIKQKRFKYLMKRTLEWSKMFTYDLKMSVLQRKEKLKRRENPSNVAIHIQYQYSPLNMFCTINQLFERTWIKVTLPIKEHILHTCNRLQHYEITLPIKLKSFGFTLEYRLLQMEHQFFQLNQRWTYS